MYATDLADLYNTTDKALYYSIAEVEEDCKYFDNEIGGAYWNKQSNSTIEYPGCFLEGGSQGYLEWCEW